MGFVINESIGESNLKLPHAKQDTILSLTQCGVCEQKPVDYLATVTQSGVCEQRNLPQGYTELDYIQSDGGQYIDLNTTLNQDDVIEIEFEIIGAQSGTNIFGYRTSASSNNIMLFFGSTSNRVFIDFNNSNYADYRLSYDVSLNTRYTAIISKSRRAILATDGTVLAESTTVCPDTITCPSAYLFAAAGTPAYNYGSPCKVYSCRINEKRDLVGAKDTSDVVEMYDKVSAAPFVNAGTGSFTAGPNATPTPSAPMDIWCNNGVLQYGVLGTNLFDPSPSAMLLNYYRNSSTGVLTPSNPNFITAGYIPVKPNTSYVLVGRRKSDNTISAWNRIYWFDADKEFISTCSYTQNTVTVATSPANAAYAQYGINYNNSTTNVVTQAEVDSYNYTFCEGTAEPATFIPFVGGVKAVGTPETITDVFGNTARVENLFAVGDYADTQEIIGGAVTRKVGVLVLDGVTDGKKFNTTWNATYKRVNMSVAGMLSSAAIVEDAMCTRFNYSSSVNSSPTKDGFCTNNGLALFSFIEDADVTSASDANAKLAAWYAAGTPVIVLYPLATETTESVSGQMLVKEPLSVTAEVTVPALTTTTAPVSVPDPKHPLPIWCNNGELKWNSTSQTVYADGTPEALILGKQNLYDSSTKIDGYYLNSSGVPSISNVSSYSAAIPVEYGESYTFSGVSSQTGSNNKRIVMYSNTTASSSTKVGDAVAVSVDGIGVSYTVTITINNVNAKYIRFSFNTADENVRCVIGSSVPPPPQIALVENLLEAGNYADTKEIISGIVNHKLGIMVLDGTENFYVSTGDTYGVAIDKNKYSGSYKDGVPVLCTHLPFSTSGSTSQTNVICNRTGNYGLRFLFNEDIMALADTKVNAVKTFLASEYANGTPMMVVYVLATEITEQTTPQLLSTEEGFNVITVTANVENIPLNSLYNAFPIKYNQMLRRYNLIAQSQSRSVVFRDVTISENATVIGAGRFTTQEANIYNMKQPDRIIIKLYPISADFSQSANAVPCLFNSGGGFIDKRLCPYDKIGFYFTDGSIDAIEVVLTLTGFKQYNILTTTNSNQRYEESGWTFDMTNKKEFQFRDFTSSISVGSRMVVIFEYN